MDLASTCWPPLMDEPSETWISQSVTEKLLFLLEIAPWRCQGAGSLRGERGDCTQCVSICSPSGPVTFGPLIHALPMEHSGCR